MTPRKKAALFFVGVFALGAVAGAGASRIYVLHQLRPAMDSSLTEARARFRLEAMKRHLDLSDEQAAKVEAIERGAEPEHEGLLSACRPGLEGLRERIDAQILEILRPEQRERYRELVARRHPVGRPGLEPSAALTERKP